MSSSVVSIFSAVTKLQELAPTELPGTTFLTILIICCLPYFWEDPFLELKGAKGEWKRNGLRKHVAPSVTIPQPILRSFHLYYLIVSYSWWKREYRSALCIVTCK